MYIRRLQLIVCIEVRNVATPILPIGQLKKHKSDIAQLKISDVEQ